MKQKKHIKRIFSFVTAATDWTVTSNQPWLTVPVKNTSNFRIAVSENTGTEERSGEITFSVGGTVISTIEVVQYGTAPTLLIDKQSWNVYGKSDTTEVTVTSNDNWNIIIDDDWVTASVSEGEDNAVVTFEVAENTGTKRETTVIFANESSGIEKTFRITQLDIVSSYFCEFDSNGNITSKDSSQYNHNLAMWSMALSYAAYNPIAYQALPFIPSGFMQEPYDDETKTAEAELESLGFEATPYNYDGGYSGYAAHTIGHKKITINNNTTGDDSNDINVTNAFDDNTNSLSSYSIPVLETDSGSNYGAYSESSKMGFMTEETLSELESNSRTLIVVSVRGSVTPLDWAMDLNNQFNLEYLNFETGCQEVIASLNSYLSSNVEIEDNPIILVTGHSLGGAIANLVAHTLNNGTSSPDVYAYTFATPNTVNSANNTPIKYTNIFNILNNNDFVPHFPFDLPGNTWTRHGQDFHITMPLNIDWIIGVDYALLGVAGHGMPNYYAWLNNLPEELGKSARNITTNDLLALSEDYAVGLAAKILKAKCPVSVTLYDNNGNIVAYESQQGGTVYPEITDVGIVSWITENNEKMFLIPYGCEALDVCVEAYDYGTMNLTVEQPGIGEPLSTITYNDVSLYPGKEFLVEVSEETLPEDTQLFVTENGEVVGEITDTNPFFKGVTVNPTEVVYGEPVTFTLVTDNTVTAMMLHGVHSGDHINIAPDEESVHVAASGENEKTWTVTYYTDGLNDGENTYDMSVQSNGVWYFYENVIALNVTAS